MTALIFSCWWATCKVYAITCTGTTYLYTCLVAQVARPQALRRSTCLISATIVHSWRLRVLWQFQTVQLHRFCNTCTVTNLWLQSTPPLWGDACHSMESCFAAPLGRCGACVLLCCNVLCLACLQHWWFMHTCTTFSMQWASLSCNQQWGDEATQLCLACLSQTLTTAALCHRGCLFLLLWGVVFLWLTVCSPPRFFWLTW